MRILVCGGRDFSDKASVFKALDAVHQKRGISLVIEGGARGADRLAYDWATERNINRVRFYADWHVYKKGAGPIRNQRMLDEGKPDAVVAFPGGSGTADMIRRSEAAGVTVWQPLKTAPHQSQ